MPNRAICFVIMPFGQKPDATGRMIDFDAIYREIIAPAIGDVGFDAVRADDEMSPGVIHNAMFERLVLSEYAIADLSIFNPNVYYELGVRHAVRPQSTVLISAGDRLPFDVVHLRAMLYALDKDGRPKDADGARKALAERLDYCKKSDEPDSPLFAYAQGWLKPPQIDHEKTDVFRRDVSYSREFKGKLLRARKAGEGREVPALDAVRDQIGDVGAAEAGVVLDLFLSYRGVNAYDRMIDLYLKMDPVLQHTTLAQEQYAFALNRVGRAAEAEDVLSTLIKERGASSETCGLLGRIYKDRWDAAKKANDIAASGWADKAISVYLTGFEADWRDAYPGVNALTLMALTKPADPRIARLAPTVRYAVERKIARGAGDYWDYATLVELAVIADDLDEAESNLPTALANLREGWEAETTARNLTLIRDAWAGAGKKTARLDAIIAALQTKAKA
ncbi:MAG: TRAFs-binding domain-containing protein [Methylocystis sp.]